MAFFKKNAYFSLAVGIALLALILFPLIVGYAQIKSAQQKAKRPESLSPAPCLPMQNLSWTRIASRA